MLICIWINARSPIFGSSSHQVCSFLLIFSCKLLLFLKSILFDVIVRGLHAGPFITYIFGGKIHSRPILVHSNFYKITSVLPSEAHFQRKTKFNSFSLKKRGCGSYDSQYLYSDCSKNDRFSLHSKVDNVVSLILFLIQYEFCR